MSLWNGYELAPPTLRKIKDKTLKPLDGWWVVFIIDPIAIRFLWLLTRVWPGATPSAVTTGSLLIGLVSAAMFWNGSWVWGAVLFQCSFMLDCVDGKLSRLRDQSSKLGAFYDGFINNVVFGTNVLGIMLSPIAGDALMIASAVLLVAWALHIHASESLKVPDRITYTYHSPREGSWLERHRLLPPMTFPDKHAVLFVVGPVSGYVLQAFIVIAALEVLTLIPKTRKVFTTLRSADKVYATDAAAVEP